MKLDIGLYDNQDPEGITITVAQNYNEDQERDVSIPMCYNSRILTDMEIGMEEWI